jgi:predicted phosphodiesterase
MSDHPDTPDLTDRQREILAALPQDSLRTWGEAVGLEKSGAESGKDRLNEHEGIDIQLVDGQWRDTGPFALTDGPSQESADSDTDTTLPDPEDAADQSDEDEDGDEADAAELPELRKPEYEAIRALPATVAELDAAVDQNPHTALELLRDDDVEIGYDPTAEKYYLADERSKQLRSKSHLSLTAKTKLAKKHLREEQAILDRRPDTTPLSIEGFAPREDAETMVAAFGDLHFGDEVTDDRGRVEYDREVAHKAADRFAREVIRHKEQWAPTFDECVVPILGDVATGTQIYDSQQTEIGDLLAQQITDGSQALTRIISTLREHFEAVRVYCVVGNHGFQSPSAARGSNTDLICYKWMDDALRREGYDDVEVTIADSTHHLNFEVRGWRFHIRHGQDSQTQVDETARSEADWRGWRDKHRFDVGIRGHHHVPSLHWVLNRYPVVTTPSPKPGGEFADRIGDPDASTPADRATERKLGYCFGVSDDRRITDSRMTDAG